MEFKKYIRENDKVWWWNEMNEMNEMEMKNGSENKICERIGE